VDLDDRDYMRERRRREGRFGGAPWFDGTNRGFDYQKGRKVQFGPHPMQKWIILLSAASFLYPMYREARRSGWLPDREAALPFPPSGASR
jgi:hypothetical protein